MPHTQEHSLTHVQSNDNQNWLQLWQDQAHNCFHQLVVNPLLPKCWPQLLLDHSQRVLVPLCGKSLDLLWLAQGGHEVIGIELSPIAVEEFFKQNNLKAKKRRIGKFMRWRAGNISVWCGDFFALTTKHLGCIDVVFDRAALTALPPSLRAEYLQQLLKLTQQNAPILLFTTEDISNGSLQADDPIDQELVALCQGHYNIALLHSEQIQGQGIDEGNTEKSYAKVYRLVK